MGLFFGREKAILKAPAFMFYASDFLSLVKGWNSDEISVHIVLLAYSWVNGPIPTDERRLKQISQYRGRRWNELLNTLTTSQWCVNSAGLLQNNSLEKIREEQKEYREKLSEAGKMGYKIKQELLKKKG